MKIRKMSGNRGRVEESRRHNFLTRLSCELILILEILSRKVITTATIIVVAKATAENITRAFYDKLARLHFARQLFL